MKKIQIKSENAWLTELERRIKEDHQNIFNRETYELYAKEYYNIDLVIDPFGIEITLEMSDKDATWFILQWGGVVLDETEIVNFNSL